MLLGEDDNLTWEERLQICLDVSHGIEYLHEGVCLMMLLSCKIYPDFDFYGYDGVLWDRQFHQWCIGTWKVQIYYWTTLWEQRCAKLICSLVLVLCARLCPCDILVHSHHQPWDSAAKKLTRQQQCHSYAMSVWFDGGWHTVSILKRSCMVLRPRIFLRFWTCD